MPVHTINLDRPASPARLSRLRGTRRSRWFARCVTMSGGGALVALGLTVPGWWWAIPVGVGLTAVAIHRASLRLTLALGVWGGGLFSVVHLGWLSSVGVDAAAAVAGLMSCWWALTMLGGRLVMNLAMWPLLVPAVWVLQEWLRSTWPLGGFPWGRLGYAAIDSPLAGWIPILGVPGMTFLLAALGTGLAAVVLSSGRRAIAGISLMMSAAVITGVGMALPEAARSAGGEFRVAVVQGGPQRGQGLDQARAVLTAHADQSRALAANATVPFALVVWPESSTDLDPLIDPWAREQVTEAVEALAAPVIVGAVTAVPGDRENVHNKALVWSPSTGPGAAYAKQRLVPFGEYVPARALLERLSSRFAQVPRDVIPGTGVPVLQVGAIALGVLICYEVAFDGNVRDAIRGGATLLAVPANNATYRGTAQPSQQLMIARFRARETERAVLVASTTGVSAIVNADGSVEARLDDGAAGHLTGSVVPNLALTPSMRWGAVTGGGVALLGLLSVTAGARQQWRARV